MGDLLGFLCVLTILTAVITVVGHGLWLIFATVLQSMSSEGANQKSARRRELLHDRVAHNGVVTLQRQLTELVDAGLLSRQAADEVLEASRTHASRQAPSSLGDRPESIRRLLAKFPELSLEQRREVLRLHDVTPAEALSNLPPVGHLHLARILAQANRSEDALRTYWRILRMFPSHPCCPATALEGAQLALQVENQTAAESLVKVARQYNLDPVQEAKLKQIEVALRPVEESVIEQVVIAEVISPDESETEEAERADSRAQKELEVVPINSDEIDEPPTAPPAEVRTPRRSLGEWLAAFMEEKNIRWGELVGGLLIVCSSIALIVSLWETLEQIRYFQFFIFVSVTSAVFGVGFYTYHRWKLHATSRGLLIIATLLVPLTALAMAGTQRGQPLEAWTVLSEVAAIGIFAWLMSFSGKILTPHARWWHVLSVVGNAALILILARLAGDLHPSPASTALMALLPVGVFAVSATAASRSTSSVQQLDAPNAANQFTWLGAAVFALLASWGLLLASSPDRSALLDTLAMMLPLASLPCALIGLRVARGVEHEDHLAGFRTAGISIALCAGAVMLLALGLAMPSAYSLLIVALLNGAMLSWLGLRYGLTAAHALAAACWGIGYLAATHLLLGFVGPGLPYRWELLESADIFARSGTSLVGLVLALGPFSEWLALRGGREAAAVYVRAAAVFGLVSLLLVTVAGEVETTRAAVVYGIYGLGALLLNLRWRIPTATFLGLGLLTAASLWEARSFWPWPSSYWSSILAIDALLMTTAATMVPALPSRAAVSNESRPSFESAFVRRLLETSLLLLPAAVLMAIVAVEVDAPLWSLANTLTLALVTATLFLQAGLNLSRPLAWWATSAAWATCCLAVGHYESLHPGEPAYPLAVGCLTHATLAIGAGLLLTYVLRRPFAARLYKVFSHPLGISGVVTSAASLPLLWLGGSPQVLGIAWCLTWLSLLWLVVSIISRQPAMFSGFQVASAAAAVFWLTYARSLESHWWEIASLKEYGLLLAVVALLWSASRVATRDRRRWQELLTPPWPTMDRLWLTAILGAFLFHQAATLWPLVELEIRSGMNVGGMQSSLDFDPLGLWLVLAVAATPLLSLWHRWQLWDALLLLVSGVAGCCLLANSVVTVGTTLIVLRWSLAFLFLVASCIFWLRDWLGRIGTSARCRFVLSEEDRRPLAAAALCLTATPVALCTLLHTSATWLSGGWSPAAMSLMPLLTASGLLLLPLLLPITSMLGDPLPGNHGEILHRQLDLCLIRATPFVLARDDIGNRTKHDEKIKLQC